MTATDRLKKHRQRAQVPPRDMSVLQPVPTTPIVPVKTEHTSQNLPKSRIKKTSVHLEQERHKALQVLCLSEDITMSTLLEAFDLVSEMFPEARSAIIEKAQELTQARKELGDKRRSQAFSKRLE